MNDLTKLDLEALIGLAERVADEIAGRRNAARKQYDTIAQLAYKEREDGIEGPRKALLSASWTATEAYNKLHKAHEEAWAELNIVYLATLKEAEAKYITPFKGTIDTHVCSSGRRQHPFGPYRGDSVF